MIGWITGSYSSSAKLTGSKLVVNFPNAVVPALWTMDMAQISEAVLRMETDEAGQFHLVLDKGEKKAETLASYTKRGPAVQALVRTSKAMQSYRPGETKCKRGIGRIILWILGILFLLWLAGAIWTIVTAGLSAPQSQQELSQSQALDNIPALQPTVDPNSLGVPIPLDQFLTRQN